VVADTHYDDTGLTASTVYWYKVAAVKNGTEQELSNPVSGATLSGSSPSQPSAEYLFNGNANDTSGNGHDGTIYGATLAFDRFGNMNSAYSFDGVNDYIAMPFSDSSARRDLSPGQRQL
jgi:Na+/H+ antiporter NhaB